MLAVTSPQVGDGKSVTSINLAAALAVNSASGVLLIDADLRRSSVAASLGIRRAPGLREVLQRRCSLDEAVVRVQQIPNLSILPAGEGVENPAELFGGEQWRN